MQQEQRFLFGIGAMVFTAFFLSGSIKEIPQKLKEEIIVKSRVKFSGIASFYADAFHGKYTANWKDRERFDMYAMTAAHKTLPFGTILNVLNKTNNKSVVVRINDRGPYWKDRILDLSYAAAKKIGLGLGTVEGPVLEK